MLVLHELQNRNESVSLSGPPLPSAMIQQCREINRCIGIQISQSPLHVSHTHQLYDKCCTLTTFCLQASIRMSLLNMQSVPAFRLTMRIHLRGVIHAALCSLKIAGSHDKDRLDAFMKMLFYGTEIKLTLNSDDRSLLHFQHWWKQYTDYCVVMLHPVSELPLSLSLSLPFCLRDTSAACTYVQPRRPSCTCHLFCISQNDSCLRE